ncbi:GATA transcription factor 12-like [Primulina eburnea]|uniref:GATA transcription factor 12-like n=1 Tax=Primulina eburnea TaxID=1245227 RepID=UPI003C6C4023
MGHFFKGYTEFPSAKTVTKFNYDNGVNFRVDHDDMLDFPKEKETMTNAFADVSLTVNSGNTSNITAVDSCNSSLSGGVRFNESQFSENELCVPYEDLAELEWLSNFVEESYSTDDLHLFIPIAAVAEKTSPSDGSSSANSTHNSPPIFPTDVIIPAKARSKRSRAVPCGWSARLLNLSPHSSPKTAPLRRRELTGKKCLHCASEKTPQWRTGPLGPKTLCNACGVRFKSGRLVPEYRPAASPTFLSSKHSNSHRKVLELRRQIQLQHQQSVDNLSDGCDDWLICHRNRVDGPDTGHLI